MALSPEQLDKINGYGASEKIDDARLEKEKRRGFVKRKLAQLAGTRNVLPTRVSQELHVLANELGTDEFEAIKTPAKYLEDSPAKSDETFHIPQIDIDQAA